MMLRFGIRVVVIVGWFRLMWEVFVLITLFRWLPLCKYIYILYRLEPRKNYIYIYIYIFLINKT